MIADDSAADDAILDGIVEELLACARGGSKPDAGALASRHPHLADRIHQLVPALFAMERAAAPHNDRVGHVPNRLGEFRIIRFLGGGSMGMVYEAVRESNGGSPDRRYAIKILLPGRTRHDLDRFRQEASATDRLRHPNIVPIHGIFESGGMHYLVMDLIIGEGANRVLADLRAKVEFEPETPTPQLAHDSFFGIPESSTTEPDQPRIADLVAAHPTLDQHRIAARIALQAADGLAHAHRNGVVHRDVKPSNILIDRNLKAWIADFGLAKVDRADNLTRRGEVVGTLRYLAPERFRGESQPACDIYGLGTTLYELLTLRPAFPQNDLQELQHAVLFLSPPPPRVIDSNIPHELETIVLKAIEREPKRRYANMTAFRDDLQRFLDGLPPLARRPSPRQQIRHWVRQNPALAVACALILFGTMAATAIFARQNWRLATALADSEAQIMMARENQLELLLQQARARVQGRAIGRRFETLELLDRADRFAREIGRRSAIDDTLRELTVAALAVPDLEAIPTGDRLPKGFKGFEIEPDGRRVGRIDAAGSLAIFRFGSADPIATFSDSVYDQFTFLSPGDRVAARTTGRELRILSFARRPAPDPIVIRDAISWSLVPGAARFVVLHGNGDLACYRAADGVVASRVPSGLSIAKHAENWMLALHPTKPIVAAANYYIERPCYVIDAQTGTARHALTNTGWATALAWHPDGESLYVAGQGPDNEPFSCLRRFDAGQQFEIAGSWTTGDVLTQLAFGPDGQRLAATGWANFATVYDSETGRVLLETPTFGEGIRLRWSKSGQRLAGHVRAGSTHVWKFEPGRELRTLQLHENGAATPVSRPFFHSRERIVVASGADRCAFWDLETGRLLKRMPTYDSIVLPHARDGELLLHHADGTFPTERLDVRYENVGGRRIEVTYHETLRLPTPLLQQSADGRVKVGIGSQQDHYWLERDDSLTQWTVPAGTSGVSLSANGRRAVTQTGNRSLTIWDLERLVPITEFVESISSSPRFSPDGRWLWTGSANGDILESGGWKRRASVGGSHVPAVFAADGSWVAVASAEGRIQLYEPDSGRPLLALEHPQRLSLSELLATKDGQYLLGVSSRSDRGLHVWDLSLIRRRLRELDRAWK
jgi:eukaryotic-like serine/threonine-protein kinase